MCAPPPVSRGSTFHSFPLLDPLYGTPQGAPEAEIENEDAPGRWSYVPAILISHHFLGLTLVTSNSVMRTYRLSVHSVKQ